MNRRLPETAARVLRFIWGDDPQYRDRTSLKAILRLVIVAGGIYAIAACLSVYAPAWNRAYRYYFRAFGDVVFSQFWVYPQASVRFVDLSSPTLVADIRLASRPHILPDGFPVPAPDPVKDTLMVLKNTSGDHPGIGLLRTSSRPIGYWPTWVIVALALATPWTWKRRKWVLFWNLLLVHVFIAVRLSVFLMKGGFADASKSFRLFALNDTWFGWLKRFDEIINDDPAVHFIAPIFVWLIVMTGMNVTRGVRQRASSLASKTAPRKSRRGRRAF